MIFATAWLVILFVTAAFGDLTTSTEFLNEKSDTEIEGTTQPSVIKSTTKKSSFTDNASLESTRSGRARQKDENDLAPDKDMTVEELLLFKAIIDEEEEQTEERNQKNSYPNSDENNDKTSDYGNNPENPIESKVNKDFIDMRRQETNSKVNSENSSPETQFDDPKTEVISERFGQRSRKTKQNIQDGVPLLELTQGGYERPFKRPRFRGRYSPRPDSSEQSENVQQLDRISNNRSPSTRPVVPQVTYVPSPQPPYAFGQGPLMNPAFDASARHMLAMNQILPQNGFLSPPSAEFPGYSTSAFQPQFSTINDVESFPNLSRDPNNVGMYQTMSNNPFQTPRILFQNSPQIQPQTVLVDTGRNVQSQIQQNPSASYPGFRIMEDSSTPNYATLFRNPPTNPPFQIPSNFYGNSPNAIHPFNSPTLSFLPQQTNFDNGVPSQTLRYPDAIIAQNNQRYSNNQPFDSNTSQDENKAGVPVQNAEQQVNRDGPLQTQFGISQPAENIADVYMRYPTAEAGYGIEENLPPRNHSEESSEDRKQTKDVETNSPNADPYKNILNSVRNNQRNNNSFDFPPEIFRSVPIDFGYQRPQGEMFRQYVERDRVVPNYPSRSFESRIPFNTIVSLTDTFHNVNNQQLAPQESNETPSCAKENNASVCFEDNDYPKNDILYSLSSNSFLADRLFSPQPLLNSFAFVERSDNETGQNEENYACDVATKYGMPLRAKNLAGMWRVIVNLPETFSQSVRMEVCKILGSSCSYSDSRVKTSCVQKYSLQRLLTWSPGRGIYSEVYKIPVACSCQIIDTLENVSVEN